MLLGTVRPSSPSVEAILEILRGAPPWVFVAALALLPLVGIPLSPLWMVTGATFGMKTGMILIVAGFAINFALAYLISNRLFREPLLRLFQRRGIGIPQAQPGEYSKLIIAIRVFPGLPNFMQSYLLGLANVPFRIYYLLSFPPQIAYAVGFVMFGDSIVNMEGGKIILAVSIVIAAGLLFNIVHKRQKGTTKVNEVSS